MSSEGINSVSGDIRDVTNSDYMSSSDDVAVMSSEGDSGSRVMPAAESKVIDSHIAAYPASKARVPTRGLLPDFKDLPVNGGLCCS